MNYKFGIRSISRMKGVDPLLVVIFTDALSDSPYDFAIADMGGVRTAEEQNQLFLAGKSTKDGYVKKSRHQLGKAIDIVCYKDGEITWETDVFKAVAAHIKNRALTTYKVTLVWGGDWANFVDMPHFQI